MKVIAIFALVLGLCSLAEAFGKSIRIDLASADSLSSVDVVAEDRVKKSKRDKKRVMPKQALDVSGRPIKPRGRGNGGKAGDIVDDRNELQINDVKDIDLDLAEDDCLVDLSFNLASGKVIEQRNIDVCGIDAIIVNETADAQALPVPDTPQ